MTWSRVYPRIRDVLKSYDEGGLEGLRSYYFDNPAMEIPTQSWHGRIAKAIHDGRKVSLEYELNQVIDKLRYPHERYTEGGSPDRDDLTRDEQREEL